MTAPRTREPLKGRRPERGLLGRSSSVPGDRLRAAQRLIERGVSVIPIGPHKKPMARWAAFQEAYATPDNLRAWFGNGHQDCNIGIVTGRISGLVVVDADGEDGERWAREHLPETPLMVRTAKGLHRYYRHPGVPVRNKVRLKTGDERIAVDLRGDHGYVLASGSRHPSGATYQLIGHWPASLDELPRFDPAWIAPDPAPEASARQSCQVESNEATPDHDILIRRARAYLEKTPPAIQGQGGDAHTFQVCCRLVRGFDLSDNDALELLTSWNETCVPPWSDLELRAKVEGAQKYGEEPIGGRIDDLRHARSPHDARSRPSPTRGTPPEPRRPGGASRRRGVSMSAALGQVEQGSTPSSGRYVNASPGRFGLAALIKTLTVATLCRVPSRRRQDQLARVVRWLWPGFGDA